MYLCRAKTKDMETEKNTYMKAEEITDVKSIESLDAKFDRICDWIREDYRHRREEEERRHERWIKEQKLKFEEWERKQAFEDKKVKELRDLYTNNWGRLMESLSQPAVLSLFKEMGIGITHIYEGPREDVSDPDNAIEVDTILCNTSVAVVAEVKTTCRPEDIDHFLKQMERFKTIFHEFANKTVYVAIAAIRYDGHSDHYARKKGLFVIKTTGEGVFSIDEPARRCTF